MTDEYEARAIADANYAPGECPLDAGEVWQDLVSVASQALARGRELERAAIVAWLRGEHGRPRRVGAIESREFIAGWNTAAEALAHRAENGEHLK